MQKILVKAGLFFVALVLVITSLGSNSSSASGVPFKDIKTTDEEIIYLWNKGLINGTSKTTFSPDASVTREQAAAMIGRALKLNGTLRKTSFNDVDPKNYASGYIQSAVDKGIVEGDSEGNFRPKDTITRGEMAFLLSRAFNFTQTGNVFFTDIKINTSSTSLYAAANKIATAGITNGTGDGSYEPNSELNRGQFAAFVARALNTDFRVIFKNVTIAELTVTADNLNVRKGPDASYSSYGKIYRGAKFQVYGYNGSWAYGKSGTLTGYVSTAYLAKSVTPVANTNKYVVLDAGHGGTDPGAVGHGLKEKDINLDVAKRVESLLKTKGISVYMTRSTDIFIPLASRVDLAKKSGGNAFVSIHTNAATPSASGSETFYSAALDQRALESKQLATFIQNRLYKAMNNNNRGVKEAGYLVIGSNPLPAALVELGFITNSTDASKLASATYKQRASEAIASGIDDYYKWKANN
ncbi:N-acetylmuramoyl-L-alanine amidase [Planococcus shenhongbingii]|uniref:N-acetylmuramoyl-L-alanine amidase n=1 Tax=Planococcus shenhongbingii TaxID=3058398 RepID=UPI00262DF15C|nr:N-acetylmuramoyl-L-alanine amidase [Planococcus sp. N016]WKA57844.1 N-acetylmuramoyl-L-alanine amidase [Planococcus sp. N016]